MNNIYKEKLLNVDKYKYKVMFILTNDEKQTNSNHPSLKLKLNRFSSQTIQHKYKRRKCIYIIFDMDEIINWGIKKSYLSRNMIYPCMLGTSLILKENKISIIGSNDGIDNQFIKLFEELYYYCDEFLHRALSDLLRPLLGQKRERDIDYWQYPTTTAFEGGEIKY